MILKQEFETLLSTNGVENCNANTILQTSKQIVDGWQDFRVNNERKINFRIDDNMQFIYTPVDGKERQVDISEFAFSQLCTRLGVPASYVKKCFENGKIHLALQNFHAWAGDMNKNILVREHKGIVRAILSEGYKSFDSYKVIKTLNNVVDDKIYKPSQVFLSTDRLHMRYVNYEPLPIDNDGSPLYAGFTVDSSDVGRGSLNMKFFIYRSVCTNGMVVSKLGGTLFRQNHIGSAITGGKMELFNRALINIDHISKNATKIIKDSKQTYLKDYELEMYLEKARRELKLSEKSQEKLVSLINNTYDRTKWGFINSITELAQQFTLDTRINFETFAGELFAKAA